MKGSASPSAARVLAPAKINLHLDVLGKRDDGFHELDTTMVSVGLCDELKLRAVPAPGVHFTLDGPAATADIPRDTNNLAARAAQIVLKRSGAEGGLELNLLKRIPSQSGLGGASSDAAAALAGAEEALGFVLSNEDRIAILSGLGSDCVFFEEARNTGAARCTGRGELVSTLPAPEPAWHVVLVCPDVEVSTAGIFRALDAPVFLPLSEAPLRPTVQKGLTSHRVGEIQSCLRNQLEDAALDNFPKLRAWRRMFDGLESGIDSSGGRSSAGRYIMTGSGSTYFALFASADEAEGSLGDVKRAAEGRGLTMRSSFLTETCGFGLRVSNVT